MDKNNFIKLTYKGKTSVVRAKEKNFFKSQGAKIEVPTEEEILQYFPELKVSKPVQPESKSTKGMIPKKEHEAIIAGMIPKTEHEAIIAELNAELEKCKTPNS